jgi:hypothetical protein
MFDDAALGAMKRVLVTESVDKATTTTTTTTTDLHARKERMLLRPGPVSASDVTEHTTKPTDATEHKMPPQGRCN